MIDGRHVSLSVPAGVLALQRPHPRRSHGALLRRLPVLRASHRERLLLRHVPGWPEVSVLVYLAFMEGVSGVRERKKR